MNANDNLEPAAPKAAYQLVPGDFVPVPHPDIVAMGAVSAVPASFGVVEGGTIPYKPEALARRDDNAANWLERDPEVKCYMQACRVLLICLIRFRYSRARARSSSPIPRWRCAQCLSGRSRSAPLTPGWANLTDTGTETPGWLRLQGLMTALV